MPLSTTSGLIKAVKKPTVKRLREVIRIFLTESEKHCFTGLSIRGEELVVRKQHSLYRFKNHVFFKRDE